MRRYFPVFVASVAILSALAPRARAASSAEECVAFQRTQQASGLLFDVTNNCDKNLACSLTWTLTCENDKGKPTSSSRQGARFTVDSSSSHAETGSAAACTSAGWRIDDVAWSCAPAK